MSMRTSVVYGWGFDTDGIRNIDILLFLKHNIGDLLYKVRDVDKNHDRAKKIQAADYQLSMIDVEYLKTLTEDDDDLWDIIYSETEYLADALTGITNDPENYRFLDTVAEVISAKTGLQLQYEVAQSDECYGDPAIILPEGMPWQENAAERKLSSEQEFIDILSEYTKELGIPNEPIEHKAIEYYG